MLSRRTSVLLPLLLLLAAPAHAWDAATVLPAGDSSVPAVFSRAAISADGDGWAYGYNGQILRLHDGRITRADLPSSFGSSRFVSVPSLMPDGGAVAPIYDEGCTLQRFRSDGRAHWATTPCGEVLPNADGSLWLIADQTEPGTPPVLQRLGSDGQSIALPDPSLQQELVGRFDDRRRLFPVPGGDGVLYVGTVHDGGIRARIVRLDGAGRLVWRWQSGDIWRYGTRAAVTPDGDVVLSGNTEAPTSATAVGQLQVARVSAGGQLRWINRTAARISGGQQSVFGHRDGGATVHAPGAALGDRLLVRLRADGSVAWEKNIGIEAADEFNTLPLLDEAADGSTLVMGDGAIGPDAGIRFVRIGAAGDIRVDRILGAGKAALRAGDAIYLLGGPYGPLTRVSEDGTTTATAYSGAKIPAEMKTVASASGADGAEFLLTAETDDSSGRPRYTVTRVDADGRIAWQHDGADLVVDGAIGANASRVCSLTRRERSAPGEYARNAAHLECLDARNGQVAWQRELIPHTSGTPALALLPDGNLIYVINQYEGHRVELLDADGRVLRTTNGNYPPIGVTSSRNGHFALALSTGTGGRDGLAVYGPDARLRYAVASADLGMPYYPDVIAVDDGGAVAAFGLAGGGAANESAGAVYYTDPANNRSWRTRLPTWREDGYHATLAFGGDAIFVAQRRFATPDPTSLPLHPRPTRLYALERSSGSSRWQTESVNVDALTHVMAPSADGQRLLSIHGDRRRLHLELYDGSNGGRVAESWQDCAALECDPLRLSNGSDGVSRLVARAQTSRYGKGAAVYRQRGLDRPPLITRPGQPGIAGAWWSPYANGEGVTFDWLPASRTVFGAWFTYSTSGGNAASALRWYTVQANGVAEDTRTLELPILQTSGGVFDAGPAVSPQRVGTAQLEFHDCNKATLRYAFDAPANDGRQGTITLSRLSPATQPCLLADGSSIPGAGAQPPQNGFDARLSGSWFDEATAGQGLEFTVQPGGVFFAPWFTFDPAGTADDAGRQHWFTLQGDLAQARDGKAKLVLVQTLGGAFDSQPTYNANAIGSATLRVLGCDRAELDYRVDDTIGAGAFRGRSGTLRLTRAGGCAP